MISAPAPGRVVRRFLRPGAWLFVLVVLSLVGGVHPVPARAAAAVAGMVTVPGARQVTASWDAVAGASRYTLEVSRSASMTAPKHSATTGTTATVTKLKLRTTYWVRVTATVGGAAVQSAVTQVRTSSASPGRGTITSAGPAGTDAVRVTWQPFSRATSLELRVSWDNTPLQQNQKDSYFTVGGLPATATSATITIPASFRSYVGSASGNPAYVQLVSRNGSTVRRSRIAIAWAGSPAASGPTVRVASYNVMSVAASSDLAGRTWSDRRRAVAATIERAGADVIAVQEATTADFSIGGVTHDQYQDLATLLGEDYRLAYDEGAVGNAETGATKGDHILYRPDRVEVLDGGVESGRALAGTSWGSSINRYFGWAKLRTKQTGQVFFVVSVHLLPGSSAHLQTLRKQVVAALDDFVARRNTGGAAVVLAGDLNSTIANYPSGAPTRLVELGYTDAATAIKRTGAQHSTSNSGYPTRPPTNTYTGNRIDYIFVKGGTPAAYANQLVLSGDGCFDPAYQGSDHNLQWADLTLG